MNETTHFFGAFVDVEVRQINRIRTVRWCDNGHQGNTPFCPQCGKQFYEESVVDMAYPSDCYELLDDYLYLADTLKDTTPRAVRGYGHIFLRSNIVGTNTEWLEIDRHTSGIEWRPFPTEAQQNAMKAALLAMPAVKALQAHPAVISVTVHAGYIEDTEY